MKFVKENNLTTKKERYRTQLQRAQYGSRIDAIRRIMWNWPPPAQARIISILSWKTKKINYSNIKGISQSPYLKVDLFSFNEVHIGPVEIKLRPMSSNPVKFFCRCCQSLCFEIQSANSTKNKCLTLQAFGHNSQQPPIKHANYIFHPTEPFAIRVGRIGIHERSTGDPYNDQRISFHFYKPL